jgi:hypothetical protein
MSIEKELLKRMRDVLRGLEETHYDLYWDIQSELEKIEHKREPPQTAREMYQRGYAAAKRELKPLSDATIAELWGEEHSGSTSMVKNYARAIEKAHGITGETK